MGPPERNEDWFTRIYAAQYPQIVKYGLRRLADADASDELAQEVFVIAWRRRGEVPDNSKISSSSDGRPASRAPRRQERRSPREAGS